MNWLETLIKSLESRLERIFRWGASEETGADLDRFMDTVLKICDIVTRVLDAINEKLTGEEKWAGGRYLMDWIRKASKSAAITLLDHKKKGTIEDAVEIMGAVDENGEQALALRFLKYVPVKDFEVIVQAKLSGALDRVNSGQIDALLGIAIGQHVGVKMAVGHIEEAGE
jgi:hypothetical protein